MATPAAFPITTIASEQAFFLSEVLGAKVTLGGKKVGKLTDVVIRENGTLPVVTHVFVSLPFGVNALIPWDQIATIGPKEIAVAANDIGPYKGEPDEKAVLLKDYIVDKKAIDLDGRDLDVVYDVRLVRKNGRLYVSEVDLSRYGLLRRMGLAWLANFIYSLAESIREQMISWTYIRPLPEKLGRFHGDLQLKVLKEELADMHPVDLADILEELEHAERVKLFEGLDTEHASYTLEEIDPSVQRALVSSLNIERVTQLIDKMTPGQAADIVSILSGAEAAGILQRLSPDNADKIRAIIHQHEENILNYATQEYLAYPPETTVEQAQDHYRQAAKGKDVVMYLYVVDPGGRLLGVIDIKELLQADERACLQAIMVDHVITLDPRSTLRDAAQMFARYDFRAIPIVDDGGKLLGVVPYRDVMGLKHRFVE
jgi:magnesium transporter